MGPISGLFQFSGPLPLTGQSRSELGQAKPRSLNPLLPGQGIQLGLARAVIPDQAIPLDAGDPRLVDREAVPQLPRVIVLVVNPSPSDSPRQETLSNSVARAGLTFPPRIAGFLLPHG